MRCIIALMGVRHLQAASIILVTLSLVFIAFVYWTEPKNLAEVATKGSVAIGTYQIDRAQFDAGIAAFRQERFAEARAAFDRADPERRDAATQFYIGFSYYREGWGRVSNDDTLFTAGLGVANRLIAIDPNFRTSDPALGIKTAVELKNEFEEGLKITASDFNPMKLTRERK